MAIPDSGNVFERVWKAMSSLCDEGPLADRLESVIRQIISLRVDEFPEVLQSDFIAVTQGIGTARAPVATHEDRHRLAQDFCTLYTKCARLDGTLQEVVGDLSTD